MDTNNVSSFGIANGLTWAQPLPPNLLIKFVFLQFELIKFIRLAQIYALFLKNFTRSFLRRREKVKNPSQLQNRHQRIQNLFHFSHWPHYSNPRYSLKNYQLDNKYCVSRRSRWNIFYNLLEIYPHFLFFNKLLGKLIHQFFKTVIGKNHVGYFS